MAASANDLFMEVGTPGTATTLSAPGYTAGGVAVTVGSTSNWPTATGVIFAIDEAEVVDGEEVQVAGTYNEFEGTVASGTSVTNVDWVAGVGDRDYSAGALTRVYVPVSSERENRLAQGMLGDHSQTGAHEFTTVYDPSNPTLETLKLAGVASAVNELTITNATTGAFPTISATGEADTGIDFENSEGEEILKLDAVASAVNEVTVTNAATTAAPTISATGGDSNIDLRLIPKGTGNVKRGATGGSIDWWEELGRTTLSVAGDTISITSIPARKYLRIVITALPSGAITALLRFNNDSGNNYAYNTSTNGAASSTVNTTSSIIVDVDGNAVCKFTTVDVVNIATQPKFISGIILTENGSGVANPPGMRLLSGKWQNTSSQITRVDIVNGAAGDFAIGSELVVLGHD